MKTKIKKTALKKRAFGGPGEGNFGTAGTNFQNQAKAEARNLGYTDRQDIEAYARNKAKEANAAAKQPVIPATPMKKKGGVTPKMKSKPSKKK